MRLMESLERTGEGGGGGGELTMSNWETKK